MKQGFLQALGVSLYITLIGLFIWNAEHIFGKLNNFTGPILMLMLLSFSVLVCGLIVFFKPYKLFITGKKKEAFQIIIFTTLGLFVMIILFLSGILLFR